jgi:uncharacterized spore protein YtfJ
MADNEKMGQVFDRAEKSQAQSLEALGRLFDVARAETVFGEPLQQGDYTLITASEVTVGLGFGFGVGGGEGIMDEEEDAGGEGFGGGGGGGGGSMGRPVAVIAVGPHGVIVEPVVDATKVALAFATALGSMFLMFSRMRRASRG